MAKINLSKIPRKPGVYLFKDKSGDLLYIGKAKQLKSRVAAYFRQSSSLTPHKQLMVKKIAKVEYIITSSETEALLLESSLIKKHQPPYNIDLKDDKNFLYIKISADEDYPRVFTARKILNDRAKYFGPYVSGLSVRETLRLLRKLFPHRNFPKPPSAAQLKYLSGRYPELLGPADKQEYRQTIERIVGFLKGDYREIIDNLKKKMSEAAGRRQYETAAACRDKIAAVRKIAEKQKMISLKKEDQDILSLARDGNLGVINLFTVRSGKLIGKQNFVLKNTTGQADREIIQAFIEQYYPRAADRPKSLVVPSAPDNKKVIAEAFGFKINVPKKGVKKQYLKLGQENAQNYLENQLYAWQQNERKTKAALNQFKKTLQLKKIPRRVEIYDISNIQGVAAVGSMVVFTAGQPDKKWYRKFKIKTVAGANDPAMLAEILKRRFSRTDDEKNWPRPDLIILDGGRGQLNAVRRNVKLNIPIAALAKKQEDIYLPGNHQPVNFLPGSAGLYLIQRMRDEAHRFAVAFFRKTHQRQSYQTALDDLPGLGPKRKKLLIKKYGSAENIRQAAKKDLRRLIGAGPADLIKKNL